VLVSEPKAGAIASEPLPARIAEELTRIEAALHDAGTSAERWGQLYAAQQALLWATSKDLAAAPYNVIMQGKVQPPTGIPAG
jgi:hypothetical protein